MKVFVGWAYEATWIDDYAIPLIESYDVDVITGKELQGAVITDGVKAGIKEADAAVFFTTRRGQDQNGTWKTSDWVVDEIKHANSLEKDPILEIREKGVDYPNKIHDERQYIVAEPGDHSKCLVELGKTISRWRGLSFKLKLMPEEFIKAVRNRIAQKSYDCTYSIRRQGRMVFGPMKAEIIKEGQGLFVYAYDLPADTFPDAFIEVSVNIGGDLWSSPGIQLSAVDVTLEKL